MPPESTLTPADALDALAAMPDGVAVWDASGGLAYANELWRALMAAAGRDPAQPFDEEAEIATGPQSWARVAVGARPGGGRVALARDVSEARNRAMESERDRRAYLTALDAIDDAISVRDADERLVAWNRRYAELARLYGAAAAVRSGASYEEYLELAARQYPPLAAAPDMMRAWMDFYLKVHRAREKNVEVPVLPDRWARYSIHDTGDGGAVTVRNDITDLRRRTEELKDAMSSAERASAEARGARATLEQMLESMADGVAFWNRERKLEMCNAVWRRVMGDLPELTMPGIDLEASTRFAVNLRLDGRALAPSGAEEEMFRRIMAAHSGEGPPVELAVGPRQWVRIASRPTPDGGLVTLATDISEQRARQRELRLTAEAAEVARAEAAAARDLLNDAVESLSDGFALWDADERLMISNKAYARAWQHLPGIEPGVKLEDLLRRYAYEVADKPAKPGREEEWIRFALEQHRSAPPQAELRLSRTDWGRATWRRTRSGGTVTMLADINDIKRRERELEAAVASAEAARAEAAQARDLLREAVAGLEDGVALWDVDDRLMVFNEAYRNAWQGLPDIRVGMTFRELIEAFADHAPVPPFRPGGRQKWIDRAMRRHREAPPPTEMLIGTHNWARASWIRTPSGRLVTPIVDIDDIKGRERDLAAALKEAEAARAEAEAATSAKSTFLATMSHEIRTPMNGVLGLLELLELSGLQAEQREIAATVRQSAVDLLRIIDDILDFSKIEAGRLELERTAFSPLDVIETALDTLAPAAQRKGLKLAAFVDPSVPARVVGDPVRLRQILFNLAGNAIKFTESGFVRATLRRLHGGPDELGVRLELAVADSGIGLDAEQQARLFQPFSQADASTTRRFGGSGLGLSIVRRLAHAMGGEASVSSAPGEGSTFRVTLRLEAAEPADGEAADSPFDLDGLSVTVALADEEERAALAAWLAAAGADVEEGGGSIPCLVVGGVPPRAVSLADARTPETAAHPLTVHRPWRRDAVLRAVAVAAGRASPEAPVAPPFPTRPAIPPGLSTRDSAGGEEGPRVLIVDDNPINLEVLARQLGMLGVRFDSAVDGAQALERWRAADYAAIVTDCHMPRMDGFALTRAVREAEREAGREGRARTPIVAVSANALAGEAERCLAAGMDAYLTKPAGIDRLRATLARWLPLGDAKAASAPPARPAFDPARLEELYGDDREAVGLIMQRLVASAQEQQAEIAAAAAAGRASVAAEAAHRLRGSALVAGADALAALLGDVERAARASDIGRVRDLLGPLAAEVRRAAREAEQR